MNYQMKYYLNCIIYIIRNKLSKLNIEQYNFHLPNIIDKDNLMNNSIDELNNINKNLDDILKRIELINNDNDVMYKYIFLEKI